MAISAKSIGALMTCLLIWAGAPRAQAQLSSDQVTSEDLEPRTIGTAGATLIGIAGYIDKFSSSENTFPTLYTVHVDVTRFLSDRIALRGGLAGNGSFGGDEDEGTTGIGVPALHGLVGALVYFSPQAMLSLYTGVDYWAQITNRSDPDAGSLVGTLGVQGAVSSRASLYIEGGYGIGLSKGPDDETLRRFVGRVGVRLKF